MNKKTMCCAITPNGRCKKEAEFEIVYGNEVSDVTESCASHIGHLVDDRIERFEVIRMSGGFRVGDTVKVIAALKGAPSEKYKVILGKGGKLILNDDMGTKLTDLNPEAIDLAY